MKRRFPALLLLIALLLGGCAAPSPAPAATAAPDPQADMAMSTQTLDLGDFTMTIFNADGVQMGEKAEGKTWCTIYPLYQPDAPFHDTIAVTWSRTDLTPVLDAVGAENYARTTVAQTVQGYESLGIAAANAALHNALYENGQLALYCSMDMDYTGAGLALQTRVHQMQIFFLRDSEGTYVFTLTADSAADLEMISYYLGAIAFKTDAAE